ncbi:hypothetical protein O181_062933 [Austropuccinia psidii MF-1]|uniref:CCHC-type domain-containing protein n=1 Tax=Austropuccinia psidii MF-1 TaxID=1389203 RepID=A0A9Q3EKH1_9BASI|nr:hypothetical protein [Austropuccinia psidii MF-1]
MTPALQKEGPVASTSSKTAPEVSKDKPKGPQKKHKGPKNHKGKGKGKANWHRHYPQGQRAGKDEQDISRQIIQEIQFVESSINVELGKFDAKLNKITSDINKLKRNDKYYTKWYKLKKVRLDSTTNTYDRIERKCQVQEDGIGDISISHINEQLAILRSQVLEIINNTNQFDTHLAKSDSEKQKLKNEILANMEKIHKNYEPHIPRHSTPFNEEKCSVKGSLTTFLGQIPICEKDIPKLEEWPTFSGEGEYNHIEFIRTIDMLHKDSHIPDEIIVGKLHSLFTRSAKKRYYKMRQDHGKHDWPWWKSEIITKWANKSWRFKRENDFESEIFNSEKDKPLTWFLKQKDRLSALHPNMSDSMINIKISRKCGGELEHAIKCRCVGPCSTEEYTNAMEDIITRTRIGKTWARIPMESKMVSKTSREYKRPERPVLKCHKCGSTSHLANACTKKAKINEAQCTEEKGESDLDSAVSEDTPVEDYLI